jgi:lambda family phage portal protein
MLDPSQLETDVNGRPEGTASGNVVRAGVELTPFNRPAAYWMRAHVPNDDPAALNAPLRKRVRIPAEEMLHLFLPEWPQQIRGVPWIANGIRALAMLDGYGEAELTAARVAAAKMGFYRMDADAEPDGELADDGALVQEASAGTFELLPKGVDFQQFDPQHPTTAFKEFVSAMLRPVAAGAGVSYNAFANDAEGMNYSALRATELEDRDEFRTLQHWMISGLCEPVFTAWLREALITGALGLPAGKMWKFDAPNFVPRGWQWVDPLKEVAAVEKAVALGISSRTATVAAQGGDFAETIAELKAEKALMGDLIPPAAAPAAPVEPDADDED